MNSRKTILCSWLVLVVSIADHGRGQVIQPSLDYLLDAKSSIVKNQDRSFPCGDDSNEDFPPDRAVFEWENDFIALTRLGYHFMPDFPPDGDSMTEPVGLAGAVPEPFGSDGLREIWYISKDPLPETGPLYRLASVDAHMDSPDPDAASDLGFTLDLLHGHAWTTPRSDMKPLTRYFRSDIFDHRLFLADQTPDGYQLGIRWDSSTIHPRYGFERLGSKLEACHVAQSENLDVLSNSVFEVRFNRIWGNAIGSIVHLPSGQELVRDGPGEMVQATLWAGTPPDAGSCCKYNPTQAGGIDGFNGMNTKRWAGGAVTSTIFRQEQGLPQQITEVRPINWLFTFWEGTDGYSPLMWRGTFKKVTTLGQHLGGATHENIVKIRFRAKVDDDAPPAMIRRAGMANTFWLSMNPIGDGNVDDFPVELLNARTGEILELGHPPGGWNDVITTFGAVDKAIVVSSADLGFSYGVYSSADDLSHYNLRFWCDGAVPDPDCLFPFQAVVVTSFNTQDLETAYTHSEDTYFVVGERAEVVDLVVEIFKELHPEIFADDFESGNLNSWSGADP